MFVVGVIVTGGVVVLSFKKEVGVSISEDLITFSSGVLDCTSDFFGSSKGWGIEESVTVVELVEVSATPE